MTKENCIKLLEMYKKQAENPVDSDGRPLHGDQRKHAVERSKMNYRNMALNILSSKRFNGGTIEVRIKGGRVMKQFEKHPIVDELKAEFGLLEKPKPEPKVEEPIEEKPKNAKKSKG